MATLAKIAGARAGLAQQQKATSAASSCPSLAGSPLKRSFFSASFLATPPNAVQSIYVADGVKLVDWPIEEMRDFLGAQRQWPQYMLRDDKLCRQVVAVFYTAYDQVIDKSAEPRVNPMDLIPFAGEHKPLVMMGDVDWIAPHLMNTLVGMIVEHGYVPERSARVLNALIDPQRNRRLAVQVGFVLLLNGVMWLVFCIDFIHARIGTDDDAAGGNGTTTTPPPIAEDNSTGVEANSTALANATNSTGGQDLSEFEYVYPSSPWPIYLHGVYPRQTQGLKGIPAMCFLHYTAAQLGVNSFGFVLFGGILIVKHGGRIFALLSAWLWFFAGFGTWVIGRDQNHIGCSGMIYGYFAYILLIGILKLLGCPPRCTNVVCTLDSTQDILIACALIALYTGILYGVLPKSGGGTGSLPEALQLTWEIDLMGWLGGTLFAAALAVYLRKSAAFKKAPGHGNKAPKAGKRFTSAAATRGSAAAMPSASSPFGAPGSTELADNPFLAHLPQQPPPRDAAFAQNYAPMQAPPPLPAAPPEQTSYV